MQRLQVVSDEVLSVTPGLSIRHFTGWKNENLLSRPGVHLKIIAKQNFHELSTAGRRQLKAERKQWEIFSGVVALVLRDA